MSYTKKSILIMQSSAAAGYNSILKIMQKLGKLNSRKLDNLVNELHNKEFSQIDCLECANCCKTISPAIYGSDLRRMALALKMKTTDFIDNYLLKDEEDDYVFRETPCPFLGDDNYCAIYESRPKACREYPHTDRKRFYQILELTAKNSKVCPTVFNIIGRLRRSLQN
jgi:Fe-S-cluster containining protein